MKKEAYPSLIDGPIVKTLLSLALPIMASSFLSTAYNICDMAWVGTLGAKAVAGVGVGGMYLWLSGGIVALPRMGGQVMTAQSIGRGEVKEARCYARAALQLVVLLSLLFAGICLFLTQQLVDFFKLTDELSKQVAISYTRITCGCIIFSFLNIVLTGLYTSMGDSRTPLFASFFGLSLNMILDPFLIIGYGFFPKMEADGAAVATVISQALVTTILIFRMNQAQGKNNMFSKQNYLLPVSPIYYKQIGRIGIPSSLQSMAYCFFSMVLTRMIAHFGAEAVAVQRVGGQIESITWNTADGFSSALNAFCGQNYGAGKYHRIRKGYTFSLIATFCWGTLVLLCFVLFPGMISNVFFHEDAVIAISVSYLFIVGFSEPFMAVELVTSGAIAGLGLTRLCSILSITFTGMRIPLAILLSKTALELDGIWWALTMTSIIKGILFTLTFQIIISTRQSKRF